MKAKYKLWKKAPNKKLWATAGGCTLLFAALVVFTVSNKSAGFFRLAARVAYTFRMVGPAQTFAVASALRDVRNPEAFLVLGDIARFRGDHEREFSSKLSYYQLALSSYTRAANLDRVGAEGFQRIGNLYFSSVADYPAAARNYRQAFEANSELAESKNGMITSESLACDTGNDIFCHMLGARFFAGDEVEKSVAKAEEFVSKGCKIKWRASCDTKVSKNLNRAVRVLASINVEELRRPVKSH